MNRRRFLEVGIGGTAVFSRPAIGGPAMPRGIKLGTFFPDNPTENDIAMLRHAGVETVSIWTSIANNNAEWMLKMRSKMEANGIWIYNIGILDLHCDPTLVLGTGGVAEKIEQYKAYLNNLGRAGIPYTTYAHMANIKDQPTPGFYQTSKATTRGDAPTREFDVNVAKGLPCSFGATYDEEHVWKTFTQFIRAVMPAAEKNGVRIGLTRMTRPLPLWDALRESSAPTMLTSGRSRLPTRRTSACAFVLVRGPRAVSRSSARSQWKRYACLRSRNGCSKCTFVTSALLCLSSAKHLSTTGMSTCSK